MHDHTLLITSGRNPHDNHGVVNPPVLRTSTVLHASVAAYAAPRAPRTMRYGRDGTPTTFALERAVAQLEGAHGAIAVASGKAAVVLSLTAFLEAGDHVLIVDTAYGPTRQYCDHFLSRFGVETTYYDPLVGAGIDGLMRANTRVVFVESPGSQTFEVQDVPAIAAAAHARGAVVIMDNTWATPLCFKPFAHGVDVSVHAATKYIVGHSDAMLGIACTTAEHIKALEQGMRDVGAAASPEDCYLGLRGLRTMAVRLEQHQESALRVAAWLREQPEVAEVLYPALPGAPGHDLWRRDYLGASGLFGVALRPASDAAVAAMVDGLELFGIGASWGGYESLATIIHPKRTATRWQPAGPTLRLHIGLEDADDLIADLRGGLDRLRAAQ